MSLQLCLTLCDSMDHILPGSSIHGMLQARILEWVAMAPSRGSSWPRGQTHISLLQFSCSAMSDTLWPHGLQHTRLPCPSSTPRACSNSSPSSCWCHPTISSSVVPFSFCLQSFPPSESFPMSKLFASGGQSIGVSASASVLTMNIPDWFPLGLTGLISLQSKGLSRVFSNNTVQKTSKEFKEFKRIHRSILRLSVFFTVQLSHPYITTEKP